MQRSSVLDKLKSSRSVRLRGFTAFAGNLTIRHVVGILTVSSNSMPWLAPPGFIPLLSWSNWRVVACVVIRTCRLECVAIRSDGRFKLVVLASRQERDWRRHRRGLTRAGAKNYSDEEELNRLGPCFFAIDRRNLGLRRLKPSCELYSMA